MESGYKERQIKITYTSSGGEAVALVRAVLLIDYDVIINKPSSNVTATVTGKSSNPADVIDYIANVSGHNINAGSLEKIRVWSNSLFYNRRIDKKIDALTLLDMSIKQINADLYSDMSVIRFFDTSLSAVIDEDDLLTPESFFWSNDLFNNISFKYNHDGNRYTNIITADVDNNDHCKLNYSKIKETRSVEIQLGFITDATTAGQYRSDFTARNSVLKKFINLELPFTYSLKEGDRIDYKDSFYRIINLDTDNTWISLTAEAMQ